MLNAGLPARDPNADSLAAVLDAAMLADSDIPRSARTRAARLLVDTLAVAMAGSGDPFCREYVASMADASGAGASSVVARSTGMMPELAAMANALPTTVLQIDEGHRLSGSHPAIQVIPAALAVAEDLDSDGPQLLCAIVRGYEVAARVGLALAPMRAGVHTNGTSGTIGAGVAAASLWGLGPEPMARLISGLASAPFVPRLSAAYDGDTVLHMYAGLGAMVGVSMARAARSGVTASASALDDHFLQQLGRRPVELSGDFLILDSYFKFYPACAHAHTSIEALEEILDANEIAADDIERIEVRTFAGAAALTDAAPTSDLGARFSIPFLLARRAVIGELDNALLTGPDLEDPATLRLAQRVRVLEEAELSARYPETRPVRLTVVRRDGSELTASRDLPRGDSDRPEPEVAWRDKIRALVGPRADELLQFADAPAEDWCAREVGRHLRGYRPRP